MGMTSFLIGGSFGFGGQVYSNYIRKVPLSRQPWMHVIMFFTGGWIGNKAVQAEKLIVEDINKTRTGRGLPPLVPSKTWVRYSPATTATTE